MQKVYCNFSATASEPSSGFEYVMNPRPMVECNCNCRKLENKVALITEGYSCIDRAVAYDFVKEGASVAIVY